jgi:Toprim domain-containing protein/uncharacterized protein DUF3991
MHDDELDRFKRDIPLLRYAVERYGYQRARRESGCSSHVLRHPSTGDKIVVRRSPDGHWIYFSVRDDKDNGTIVDFVLARSHGLSFGRVRQELRRWLGTPRPDRDDWTTRVAPPLVRDPRAVAEAFAAAHIGPTCAYLEARGLRRETLSDPRFAGTWRLGQRGNVLFAHRDEAGALTGFEIKNRGFTSFSSGGVKTAWQSASHPEDRALVITESAVDALSYHELRGDLARDHRYLSTGGAPSGRQFALLDRIFANLPPGCAVVAAVDQDAAGTKLATALERLASVHMRVSFRRDSPTTDKDWNDVLQRTLREPAGSPEVDDPLRP